ncbi:MAG TPA: hypothetical protein VGQ99_20085 [Tepidisphaeraceae bacterium]|jgi:hypothetical protein|nr:hypothetical protein [Tepidisphaeraceae bacterium]
MADEPHVIRGINWREAFPFTNIFRAFRIAIHPSKLVLALLALLVLYFGGRVLDGLWMNRYKAVPGEIAIYERSRTSEQFFNDRNAIRETAADRYTRGLQVLATKKTEEKFKHLNDPVAARRDAGEGKWTNHVRYAVGLERLADIDAAEKEYEKEHARIIALPQTNDDQKRAVQEQEQAALARRDAAIAQARTEARAKLDIVETVEGKGLFLAFFQYQTQKIDNIVRGVLSGNWLGGLDQWMRKSADAAEADGVIVSAIKFFTVAPAWALRHHPIYFLLFGALFLVVWSLFGGAIARIAAVHVADEGRKLSVRQGLSFAVSKFLSFISAPMIPLIIVLGIGLIVAVVAGIALLIPWLGEIVVGALFFLALAAGFVMTLVLIGTAGGFNLMYPTIAVEGSDSFDAISRSFSYVYAKPWRMLFYSALAIAYGAITYLFVRLFIYLTLLLTWFFVGLFVWRQTPDHQNLWHALMPHPSFASLPYEVDSLSLNPAGSLAAFLIEFWNYLAISMLGAFAISFYFSVNTIIYYLMRREVDATEMDDVYLEQPDEEFTETPVAPSVSTAPTPAPAPSAPAAASEATSGSTETPGPEKTYEKPPPET